MEWVKYRFMYIASQSLRKLAVGPCLSSMLRDIIMGHTWRHTWGCMLRGLILGNTLRAHALGAIPGGGCGAKYTIY